jgi:YegS/Rv2252/BmrU family lipid kinase
MTQKFLIVVNPTSASGKTMKRWPTVWRALKDAEVPFDEYFTTARGDATAATRKALTDGATGVAVMGGDGTLSEAVNGFFDESGNQINPEASLALFPAGTGGDFRKSLSISKDEHTFAQSLAGGKYRTIDLGRIDYQGGSARAPRFFINIADCGIGGEVVNKVNHSKIKRASHTVFLYHSLVQLMTYEAREVELEIDGLQLKEKVQNVIFANGQFFGSGMRIAPRALLDDGLLDVVVLGETSRSHSLLGIRKVYSGKHLDEQHVGLYRGKEISVRPVGGHIHLRFDVDGEDGGEAPAKVTCLNQVLRFVG